MSEANAVTWLTDVNGVDIGVQRVDASGDVHLRLVVPSMGLDRLLTQDDATRLLALLQTGIAFAEITGTETFTINRDEL